MSLAFGLVQKSFSKRGLTYASYLAALGIAAACSGPNSSPKRVLNSGAAGTTSFEGGAGTTSAAGTTSIVFDSGVPKNQPDAQGCVAISEKANEERRPVDIIFVIDNSGSMWEEIVAIEAEINRNLAAVLDESGTDYRVLLVSRYGYGLGKICITGPLGASDCADPNITPLTHHPPRFFHYSAQIDSLNGLCQLLDGFSLPDELPSTADSVMRPWTPISPRGWSEHVRSDAFKSIVMITDDQISCAARPALALLPDYKAVEAHPQSFFLNDPPKNAERMDRGLLAFTPPIFGQTGKRNYRFHSIVGLQAPDPDNSIVLSDAPVIDKKCSSAENPGTAYQHLSIATGGLRYPVCSHAEYARVFRAIAEDAIRSAKLACEWRIPPPPAGTSFDPKAVNLNYRAGDAAAPRTIPKVQSAGACDESGGWYYDDDAAPTKMLSCPSTCAELESDPAGSVEIAFGCETVVVVK
jgi:hypothetical protein